MAAELTNINGVLPSYAKHTFSLGNFLNTPSMIMEQMATVVSAGIPEKRKWLSPQARSSVMLIAREKQAAVIVSAEKRGVSVPQHGLTVYSYYFGKQDNLTLPICTCRWSHLIARTVKEPEDLAFVLISPASVLDARGQESTLSLG